MNPLMMKFTFVGVLYGFINQSCSWIAVFMVSLNDEEQKNEPINLTFGRRKPRK